jgi:hypothetical protein
MQPVPLTTFVQVLAMGESAAVELKQVPSAGFSKGSYDANPT